MGSLCLLSDGGLPSVSCVTHYSFVRSSRASLPSLSGGAPRMLQVQLSSWLLGVLVLAVGILLPLGLAASRNKVLQQAWEKATGKTV